MNLHNVGMRGCYLCSRSSGEEKYSEVGGHFLYACRSCGLVRLERPVPQANENLYEDREYYSQHGGSGFDIEDYVKNGSRNGLAAHYERYRFRPLEREVKKRFGSGVPRYCDIGCSAGLMLAIGRDHGFDVTGVELSPVAVEKARRSLGLNVIQGSLESAELGKEAFEAISLFHVLEHLAEPRQALVKIRESLVRGGVVAIEVPNIKSLPARLRKRDWHGYVLPYHLWHFSPETLALLIGQAGLRLISMETPYLPFSASRMVNVHSLAARAARKLLKRPLAPQADAGAAGPGSHDFLVQAPAARHLMEAALRSAYWPFDRAMSFLGVGEVVYAVAEKT